MFFVLCKRQCYFKN